MTLDRPATSKGAPCELLEHGPWAAIVDGHTDGTPPSVLRVEAHDSALVGAAERLQALPNNGSVLILADRRSLRGLSNDLRAKRYPRMRPSAQRLQGAIGRAGVLSTAVWLVWPDIDRPRVLIDRGDLRQWRWAQRSGVLGGGGTRVLVRKLLRTRPFGRVLRGLAGGLVTVGRKAKDGGRA